VKVLDFLQHYSPCCGYPHHADYATTTTLLNTGVAPKRLVNSKQFSVTIFSPDFWSISWHFPDSCQIPRHFQVFQTSGHLAHSSTWDSNSPWVQSTALTTQPRLLLWWLHSTTVHIHTASTPPTSKKLVQDICFLCCTICNNCFTNYK